MFTVVTLCAPLALRPQAFSKGYPLQPRRAADAAVWLRYFYEGGTLTRDGRLLELRSTATGAAVIAALRHEGVDTERWRPHCYDAALGGWSELTEQTTFETGGEAAARIDVQLAASAVAAEEAPGASEEWPEGFFTCGVMGLKNEVNLGTLWRSAFQLGAAGMFVIGARHTQSSDVTRAWQRVPFVQHPDWNAFAAAQPHGAQWVAVEMGGEPLDTFEHPERAVYLLGSEDNGLPDSVVRACHRHVALPTVRSASFNVAVAGSLVMYDRLCKARAATRQQAQPAAAEPLAGRDPKLDRGKYNGPGRRRD